VASPRTVFKGEHELFRRSVSAFIDREVAPHYERWEKEGQVSREFSLAFAVIGLCYGGGFGTMPSFTADFFGAKYMGGIYGWILLAWGAGAIPSPLLIARVRETTGTYEPAIRTIAVVMLVSMALPWIVRRPAPHHVGSSPRPRLSVT